jgi:hypothetical protein
MLLTFQGEYINRLMMVPNPLRVGRHDLWQTCAGLVPPFFQSSAQGVQTVTTLLEAIKQAYAAGLTDGARQAEVIARIHAEHTNTAGTIARAIAGNLISESANNGARKRHHRAINKGLPLTAKDAKPTAARSAKKAAGPRVKGVKEGIMALIASGGMSVADIIAKTGFKGTSVRATLMGLKKSGLAMNDDKLWIGAGPVTGNSESEHASSDF